MNTLPEMLATVVKQNAKRTAIVDGEKVVSYAALEERIVTLVADLHRVGVCPGDRVALLLPNGLDFVTSYFAIVTLGAIAVPLNEHYQQTELLYFLDVGRVSLLITAREFSRLCQHVLSRQTEACDVFFVEDETQAAATEFRFLNERKVAIDPNAPVMYQFSSGSTGKPKCIARTHTNLLCELDSLIQALNVTNTDRFIGVAPFSHVNGLMRSMMASIRAGATLYPLAKFERQAVAEVIEQAKISVFIAVPFMFSMLAKTNYRRRPDFSSLRLCISASAPMPQKLNQHFHEHFGMYVRQLYGSTETGTISVNVSAAIEKSLESVGTPIAGVEVEIFAENGNLAKVGETGEVAVKSHAAIKSYKGLEEVTKEVFRDGYFFTGDLGKRDEDGLLYLVGRKKFFINKGGYKIDPREIEELLESHAKVEEAVAIGVPTTYGDEKVKAVVVLNGSCSEQELIEYCQGRIANFKIPSVIEFMESLPRSPTGKIRKALLL